jgi:hypothetical protein
VAARGGVVAVNHGAQVDEPEESKPIVPVAYRHGWARS